MQNKDPYAEPYRKASPKEHPGALVDGAVVLYGPLHCAQAHGGCDWCYANGYQNAAPRRCACGR